jgi:DNA mismatch repair protein MutL
MLMSKIKELDPITITKIAAGEVIDRPSSIVKELVENSLDAGATAIRVEVNDGGKRLISITDNGHGMDKEDLALSARRHTTSKIERLEDLYDTDSFGFRGEALASISHVATMDITSKSTGQDAHHIRAFQDEISEPTLCSGTQGTTIEVKDLFFDVPVRRKFLKTASTELSYITDVIIHLTLTNPSIDFVLISDGKEIINSSGIQDQAQLIIHIYGRSLKGKLLKIDSQIGPVHITGHVSDPTLTFSNKSKQVIAVNRRLIKSAVVSRAVQDSFKDYIPYRRHPLAVLNISVEKSSVDVNIHPQKQDIKFINPGFLFDAVPKAIRFALSEIKADLPTLGQTQSFGSPSSAFQGNASETSVPFKSQDSVEFAPFNASPTHGGDLSSITEQLFKPLDSSGQAPHYEYFQLFKTYIAIKTSEGLYLMDQHAAHERILYEQIKDKFDAAGARQALLLSEILDVTPAIFEVFKEHQDYFEKLNFVVEDFGENKLVVREIPVPFSDANVTELVLDILDQLKDYPGSSRDLTLDQKEKLQMRACKAAIKAGKTMYPDEVTRLVEDLVSSPSNFTCPHGRPLCLLFDKAKLERLFLRA